MQSTRKQRQPEHRAKMAAKRIERLTRTPGFQAVPNRRVNDAVMANQLLIQAAALEQGRSINIVEARDQAARQVARNLPAPRMVFDWANGLPTKNDNPEYRR